METAISSIAREQTETHEFILWEDGSLTIEDLMYQYDFNPRTDHTQLDLDGKLRLFAFLKTSIENQKN